MVKSKGRLQLWIEPEAHSARKALPGNIRQRVKRVLDALANEPRPASSRELDVSDIGIPTNIEIRRVRLDKWRILYAVNDTDGWVWILQIRKRPPYQYENLPALAAKVS